jgi:hypothetical protein
VACTHLAEARQSQRSKQRFTSQNQTIIHNKPLKHNAACTMTHTWLVVAQHASNPLALWCVFWVWRVRIRQRLVKVNGQHSG